MIINGGAAGNTGFWSKHLLRVDTNDRAEVTEISGLLATNLPSSLREMEAIAAQSRCGGNFMYQANINPRDDERLTEEQWREAIDTLENHLGLAGHQRVVVEHEKSGRVHRHVIWNRVEVETLRVQDIGGNYYTHERVARTLEVKFDLQRTASLHGERNPEGRPDRPEELSQKRAAERSGIDPKQVTAELTDLWRKTDSGKAFAVALEERGYILAQGDRRNFCIVDQSGDAHSLARRIDGAKARDVRERLAGIDSASLPTVDEARTTQREKYPTNDAARLAWEGRQGGAGTTHAPGMEQTAPREPHRRAPGERSAAGEADGGRTTQREKWHDRAATKIEERIFHIQDAAERGGVSVAAGLHNEGITLARVDAAGKNTVQRGYERQFDEAQFAGKDDARLRRAAFNEGELVAVTRYGDVHRLNPKYIDLQRLEQSACGNQPAPALSDTLEFFATNRAAEAGCKDAANAEFWEKRKEKADFRDAAREATGDARESRRERQEAAQDIKHAALTVTDMATGSVSSLSSFVESFLRMAGGGASPPTTGDMEIRQQRRALAAMEDIRESIERGESLRASDVANLTPAHLMNLKLRGDDYMRELIENLERGRERQQDDSRTRER